MCDRSVLLITEVSLRGQKCPLVFTKKQKCPFSPFFGIEVSFSLFFYQKKSNGYIFKQHFKENQPKNIGFQKQTRDSSRIPKIVLRILKKGFGILLGFYSARILKKKRDSFLGFRWDSTEAKCRILKCKVSVKWAYIRHWSFWTILVVEKVVFSTFSKLFWSCLGSVWALFSTLKKGLLFGEFSARKVDK